MKVRNTQGHYLEAISLLRDVLVNSTFEAERLRVAAKNLVPTYLPTYPTTYLPTPQAKPSFRKGCSET